jgi:hypothetical protein
MSESSERRLRLWAISSMVIVGALTVVPVDALKNLTNVFVAPNVVDYIFKILSTGVILFLVLGFYLRMLFECGLARNINNRGAWLALLIFVPLVSAFIYYWFTRSTYYRHRFSPPQT